MNFHIDVQAMVSTLPVMLNGMIGGLVVMLVICLMVLGLYKIGGSKKKEENP